MFPLVAPPGQRYLEDSAGQPFLIQGDAAWSLIADLTREEVTLYLEDRGARGFNTILVSLIEARFARNAPANAYGERPFRTRPFELLAVLDDLIPMVSFADFSAPNDAYFAHADWVLREAKKRGFLVMLTPSYVGWNGGSQGWYRAMSANGIDRLRQYGEYLGERYRDFDNIMWVHAGDYDPPNKDLVRVIADGIRRFQPGALQTAHGAPETAISEYWRNEDWLTIGNVYTYGPVHSAVFDQYAADDQLPFFLIESGYESEHGITDRQLRMQAYQAVLGGATGQVFGNNPIWHFEAPGLYPAAVTWQQALDSSGARSMTHLRALLTDLPWWLMLPDRSHSLLAVGQGGDDDRAVAALAADGSFALAYLPSAREIAIAMDGFAGRRVDARWFDPAEGTFATIAGSPFAATGQRTFRPDSLENGSGQDDWVLVLNAVPREPGPSQ